jgi:xanthine dehydrogenase molybdopterin-binding subunit B
LKWKYNPLNDSKDNDYTSSAPLVGLQVGADYGISENISLGVNLKAMYHNHNTQLIPSDTVKSEIEHSSTIVGSIGLKYSF